MPGSNPSKRKISFLFWLSVVVVALNVGVLKMDAYATRVTHGRIVFNETGTYMLIVFNSILALIWYRAGRNLGSGGSNDSNGPDSD